MTIGISSLHTELYIKQDVLACKFPLSYCICYGLSSCRHFCWTLFLEPSCCLYFVNAFHSTPMQNPPQDSQIFTLPPTSFAAIMGVCRLCVLEQYSSLDAHSSFTNAIMLRFFKLCFMIFFCLVSFLSIALFSKAQSKFSCRRKV